MNVADGIEENAVRHRSLPPRSFGLAASWSEQVAPHADHDARELLSAPSLTRHGCIVSLWQGNPILSRTTGSGDKA
jgi:hypothetical protein